MKEMKKEVDQSVSSAGWMSGMFGISTYAYSMYVFMYAVFFIGSLNENFTSAMPLTVQTMFPNALDGARYESSINWTPELLMKNSVLLGAFAVQHAIMARQFYKDFAVKYFYSFAFERSMFILAASVLLHGLILTWNPLTMVVWEIPDQFKTMTWGMFFFGWAIVFLSTFNIDHFDLFGLTRALGFKSNIEPETTLVANYFYAYVRHPIMTGFMIAFWSAPVMTQGRLLFAVMTTAFILLDVHFLEERDLKKHLPEYQRYCDQVGSFCPMGFTGYIPLGEKNKAA